MSALLIILSSFATVSSDASLVSAGDVIACDFEEAADQDFDGWPDGWTRIRSESLPEFLKIGIVPEATETGKAKVPFAASGTNNHCLQIELNGGGAMITTPRRLISAQFSLLLTARIKSAGLKYDGAWIELTLLDAEGKVVQTHASAPLTECPDWQNITIGPLTTIEDQATSAVATLRVQPLSKKEDLRGTVWFDDLRVMRLPRMQLSSNSPTGLFPRREIGPLTCSVSGIRVDKPSIRFELFDHRGERLAEAIETLSPTAETVRLNRQAPQEGYAGQASWTPPIPDFGFYRVQASLLAEGSSEALLDRSQTLAILRPLPARHGSEFGWSLHEGERPLAYGQVASLLAQAGVGWAKMPVWYDAKDTATADRIAWFAEQLSIDGIELVGVLDQPPTELRAVFREQGRLPAASVFAEPELWQPAVGPVLTRLSLKVHWWQLGADGDASFVGYPQLEAKLSEIKRGMEQYGQQVRLGVNWRWIYDVPKRTGTKAIPWSFLCQTSDPTLTAEELLTYLGHAEGEPVSPTASETAGKSAGLTLVSRSTAAGSGKQQPGNRRPVAARQWVLVEPLPSSDYSRDIRIRDFVLRMVACKMADAHAIFLPSPFDELQGVMHSDGSPGALFVPWRTTAMLLGGADYLGALPLPSGSAARLFAREGQAVMAVWNDTPVTEYVNLGSEIELIDVWGRATKPELKEIEGRWLHELSVGPMPLFIMGLNEAAARWQAAAQFEDPRITSIIGREQHVVLHLKNTFSQAVSGELTLHAPRNWGFEARPLRFKIAEGEDLRLPIPVTLMPDASSGLQPVRLDFDVGGLRFSVHRALQLGLDDVQVEITSRMKNGALLVEQHLTNLSSQPLSFQCVLFAPGRRRETRQVTNLGRDRASLVFVLPRGEDLVGQKLWLRVEEIGGARVLNYTPTAER